jgi:uncharacterized protein (TIGR02246 family)
MDKEAVTKLLTIYGEAWVTQNPDLIVSIFSDDATYNDPREPQNVGKEAIREYWNKKVIGEQKDISFDLKNVWVDADAVIAEWEANFTDTKRNLRINLKEVAIFSVQGDKFGSLREYYSSAKTPL